MTRKVTINVKVVITPGTKEIIEPWKRSWEFTFLIGSVRIEREPKVGEGKSVVTAFGE